MLDFPEDKQSGMVDIRHIHIRFLPEEKMNSKNLRQEGGLSGFPKRSESPRDAYDGTHTVPIQFRQDWDICMPEIFWDRSRSCGFCDRDGALTGGMAYKRH